MVKGQVCTYLHAYTYMHDALQIFYLLSHYTTIFSMHSIAFHLIFKVGLCIYIYSDKKNKVCVSFSILKTFSQVNLGHFETDSFHHFLPIVLSN